LVVSALNADGKLSSYSSVGANVFLSAPGGEYGQDRPAMVTVDLTGCDKGSNVSGAHKNALHGGAELDPNCDYRGTMNGTSSAAPNASGAIATVMSANPALDARTVRHILASTARKTDLTH
ncbi:peptidase S8, partial [Pseudoalteromonas ruthenica]